MRFPHLGGVLKLGFTSSFVPISTPDGSNRSLFCGQWSQSSLSTKCSRLRLYHLSTGWFSVIGCTTSAPDVSSPWGYGRVLVADHRLQSLRLPFIDFFFIGCMTSAPDGSSPRGYSQKFSGIGSKNIILSPSSLSPTIILAHFVLEIFILLFLMIRAPETMTRCGLLLDISPYSDLFIPYLSPSCCCPYCHFTFCSGLNIKAHRCTCTFNLQRPILGLLINKACCL
jgi:hypothetical protein